MRQRNFRRSLLGLMALLVLVCSLAFIGCDDDGGGGDNDAEPADLENQTFTFQNGGFFGIPAGTSFTLAFGAFNDMDMAPFTLTSGANTATGTVTVTSCLFEFATSNFPAGQGPDADDVVDTECTIEDGVLRLGDDETGTTGSSGDT